VESFIDQHDIVYVIEQNRDGQLQVSAHLWKRRLTKRKLRPRAALRRVCRSPDLVTDGILAHRQSATLRPHAAARGA
jgi:hypothetical protein